MKRINRKKIVEALEIARQGYASLILVAQQNNDIIMERVYQAHHDCKYNGRGGRKDPEAKCNQQ